MSSPFFKTIKYVILLLILGSIAYLFVFLSKTPSMMETESIIPVVIEKVERGNLSLSLSTYSYIESRSVIPILPLVSGQVLQHYVKIGDSVEKGDPISSLDDEIYVLNEKTAKASYELAFSSFERTRNLWESDSISKQVYDEVKGKYEIAKSQYELAQTQRGYTVVKSPIKGTIIASNVHEGSFAQVGTPIAVVSDLDDIIIKIPLPSKYYQTIKENEETIKVYIENVDENGKKNDIPFIIESVSPLIQPKDASFTIICSPQNNDSINVIVGSYVAIRVIYREYKDVLIFPQESAAMDSTIYTYDEKSKRVTLHSIKKEIENDQYFILDESFKDSWVVIEGAYLLHDSDIVNAQVKDEYL